MKRQANSFRQTEQHLRIWAYPSHVLSSWALPKPVVQRWPSCFWPEILTFLTSIVYRVTWELQSKWLPAERCHRLVPVWWKPTKNLTPTRNLANPHLTEPPELRHTKDSVLIKYPPGLWHTCHSFIEYAVVVLTSRLGECAHLLRTVTTLLGVSKVSNGP